MSEPKSPMRKVESWTWVLGRLALEKTTAEAYGRMMRNEARFRIMLVNGTKPHNAHELEPPV